MGVYINRGAEGFERYANGEYVDKTGMIGYVNTTIDTPESLICVTRPRRFGKSAAAQMLYAYYDKSCDSRQLFERFQVAGNPTFEQHLNKYPSIIIDMTTFTTITPPSSAASPTTSSSLASPTTRRRRGTSAA